MTTTANTALDLTAIRSPSAPTTIDLAVTGRRSRGTTGKSRTTTASGRTRGKGVEGGPGIMGEV
ncbi:hypothetical protein RchiOBHm_Chr5g0065781 [Rosa chinensis]|uniref:Uncharacterized protein n=1 Tax=Rosa chinensis TaxID=74649 RepID=A0A2P6QJ21_ROSCH|nr:hypothetical protein RchiOBHm_Chr5g0065781 [Rosa chinensis]